MRCGLSADSSARSAERSQCRLWADRTWADELLNDRQFDSLLEAQVLIEDWRIDYNINRPHSALNQSTPDQYRKNWTSPTNAKSHNPWTASWGLLITAVAPYR